MRPNNKALSPRPLCINLSTRWHIEAPTKQYIPQQMDVDNDFLFEQFLFF